MSGNVVPGSLAGVTEEAVRNTLVALRQPDVSDGRIRQLATCVEWMLDHLPMEGEIVLTLTKEQADDLVSMFGGYKSVLDKESYSLADFERKILAIVEGQLAEQGITG